MAVEIHSREWIPPSNQKPGLLAVALPVPTICHYYHFCVLENVNIVWNSADNTTPKQQHQMTE